MSNPFVFKSPVEQAALQDNSSEQVCRKFYEQTYKDYTPAAYQNYDASRHQSFDAQKTSIDVTRNLFYEESYRLFAKIEKTQPYPVRNSYNSDGRVYELERLQNSTGRHKTADAVVFVSNVFDPKKPVKLVIYNHGLETNASEAFKQSLSKQMSGADSNTVFIVPEWQTRPDQTAA